MRPQPRSTRTDTLFPDPPLFRSLRPPVADRRCRRRGAVQAPRQPLPRQPARERAGGHDGERLSGAARHAGPYRAAARPGRACRRLRPRALRPRDAEVRSRRTGVAERATAARPALRDGGRAPAGRLRSRALGSGASQPHAACRGGGGGARWLKWRLAGDGTADPSGQLPDRAALGGGFARARVGRATPKFDPVERELLNARLLHALPFETVAGRLPAGFDPALWEAVRPNLTRLAEAEGWLAICRGPVVPVIADAGFAAQAAELLPPEPWDEATWVSWTAAVKAATGRKGKELRSEEHTSELKLLMRTSDAVFCL